MPTSTSVATPEFPVTPRCDQVPVWRELGEYFAHAGQQFDVRQALEQDSSRFERMALRAPHIRADFSRNLLDETSRTLLTQLATDCELPRSIEAMFAGAPLNSTEQRAAWHVLLRQPADTVVENTGHREALTEVHESLQDVLAFAQQVRDDVQITDIVNIGIGGSDLGPSVVLEALRAHYDVGKRIHFVSNMDGTDLELKLRVLDPARTLFLLASKSFGTAETVVNAQAARSWMLKAHGYAASSASTPHHEADNPLVATALPADVPAELRELLSKRFVAMTSNHAAAQAFGVQRIFPFADWVGGRFSLWSSIGLSIAIGIGPEDFKAFLAGAHAMDQHFRHTPLAENLPVQLALLDIWYRNFHGFATRSIAPYSHALRRLPAYLQQLEMESNGKGCDWFGEKLALATAPVVWGEAGTNGQHAFFQLIHQGQQIIPVEFLVLRENKIGSAAQHRALQANAVAQARALSFGKQDGPAHTHCPGKRPSTMLVLDRLDPASVGALIALYEHRTFVAGRLWGINSFDQWGVELGKNLAKQILSPSAGATADSDVMAWLR